MQVGLMCNSLIVAIAFLQLSGNRKCTLSFSRVGGADPLICL